MSLLKSFVDGLRGLLRKDRVEQDMDEELRGYLDAAVRDKMRTGMTQEEALRAARLEMGSVEAVKERIRSAGWESALETLWQDLRYALRTLPQHPAFTATTVLILALGIGANSAIFSLINAVMLKSLPVKQPEQLVLFRWAAQGWPALVPSLSGSAETDKTGRFTSTSFAYAAFEEMRNNKALSSICAFAGAGGLNLVTNGLAGLAEGEFVSGEYFSTLGVEPLLGRAIIAEDDQPEAPGAAIISYGYWQRRFGREASVVGKNITLNHVPFTIVGVAPPQFFGVEPGRSVDIWVPIHALPLVMPDIAWSRTDWWLQMIGRLQPETNPSQALASLELMFRQSVIAGVQSLPKEIEIPELELISANKGLDSLRSQFSHPLFILMVVVGLVLLIACANVANLLLERGTTRRKEIAVRLALGAGRRRLVRQLLTETAVITVAGGALGLLLAYDASNLLVAMMSSGRGHIDLEVRPDPYVLGFTALLSIVATLFVGLVPALRSTRLNLTPALKESTGAGGPSRRFLGLRFGLGNTLVVAQVAMSLVLLVTAGLFVRTLMNLESERLGFDRRNLLLFGIDPTQQGYKDGPLVRYYEELQSRLEAIPGVRSATLSSHTLMDGGVSVWGLVLEGPPLAPAQGRNGARIDVYVNEVGPEFFRTLGIPSLLGRTVEARDTTTSPLVGVVNESFARKYLAGRAPVGLRAAWDGEASRRMEIVGVVKDARYGQMRRDPPPTYYVPYTQYPDHLGGMHFEVRTVGDPRNWVGSVREAVRSLDSSIPVSDVKTQVDEIDQATFQERIFARLTSLFGLLALLLACLGLYGVTSYSITRRTSEIGIRMALGARRSEILRCVLVEASAVAAIGLTIGLAVALPATRLISRQLYGLNPDDAITVSLATLLLALVAILAGYIPARRAAKVDPMVALRYE